MTDETPKHPGRILFEQVMTPLGVSRNKLARDIDVPVGRISDIVAGKRGVTPDTALRFAKYFGTTPELWLKLQADYDLHVARTTTWPRAEAKVGVLEPAAPAASAAPQAPVAEAPSASAPPPTASRPPAAEAPSGTPAGPSSEPSFEPSSDAPTGGGDLDLEDDEDIDIPEPVPGGGRS